MDRHSGESHTGLFVPAGSRLYLPTTCQPHASVGNDRQTVRASTTRLAPQQLADEGHLRDDVTVQEAGDIFWACTSPKLFQLLMLKRGWTPARYGQRVADIFLATLLANGLSD